MDKQNNEIALNSMKFSQSLFFFFKSAPKPTNPNSIQPVPIAKDKSEVTKHAVATSSVQIPENSLAAAPTKKKI